MAENPVTYRYPFEGTYRVTCDYACHTNRTPPSSAPGIDFACPTATTIRAAAAGTVIYVQFNPTGGGLWVMIQHRNGQRTLYSHLMASYVGKHQYLRRGDRVGLSGNTGHSTGPHLHFGVQDPQNGLKDYNWYVDPMPYLEGKAERRE